MCNGNCGMCPNRVKHIKAQISEIAKMFIESQKGEEYFKRMKQEDFVKMVDLIYESEEVHKFNAVTQKVLVDSFKEVTGETIDVV